MRERSEAGARRGCCRRLAVGTLALLSCCNLLFCYTATHLFLPTRITSSYSEVTTDVLNDKHEGLVIDIMSVGSRRLRELQDAQARTFGSHRTVRHFFRITEDDDTDKACHRSLTIGHLIKISNFCKFRNKNLPPDDRYGALRRMTVNFARMQWLRKKANPIGWMCAQKRPFDGLAKVIKRYQLEPLPDYLLVADDDTWFSMGRLEETLPGLYPPLGNSYVVAGCLVRSRVNENNFTVPFGGWGTMLNKRAIQNLLRPIRCKEEASDEFTRLACWRLEQNSIGEQPRFREGMSVAELIFAYVRHQRYRDVDYWNDVGFCLHSDWVWGYFLNFYHIPVHTGAEYFADVVEDRLRGYNGSELYDGKATPARTAKLMECNHWGDEKCTPDSTICHYVTAAHMDSLHLHNMSKAQSQARFQ